MEEIETFLSKYLEYTDVILLMNVLKIYFATKTSSDEIINLIKEYGVKINKNILSQLKEIIQRAKPRVRLWENKGFSENEIKVLHGK